MSEYLNFGEIKDRIAGIAKQWTGSRDTEIGYMINMVYLTEIINADTLWPMFWLCQLVTSRLSVAPATITGITQANPGVVTAASHGLSSSDIINLYGVLGMTGVNSQLLVVTKIDADSFSIGIDTSGYSAYTSGGKAYHRGITLSHTIDHVLSAGWSGYNGVMTPSRPLDWDKNVYNHELDITSGPPQRYYFGKSLANDGTETNQLIWSPASDAEYRLRYWYKQPVSRLTDDAHVPTLPPRFHDMLVTGVVARMAKGDGSQQVGVENQTLWPTIYSAQLSTIVQFNRQYWESIDDQIPVKHYLA
jgi:Ubiquitin-activating enzyme E1 FCCH domain